MIPYKSFTMVAVYNAGYKYCSIVTFSQLMMLLRRNDEAV